MCMYERRLQILLDDDRYRRVSSAAQARGSSVASVIRDAIDLALPAGLERKAASAAALLAAPPAPVPDLPELRAELDEIRSGGH